MLQQKTALKIMFYGLPVLFPFLEPAKTLLGENIWLAFALVGLAFVFSCVGQGKAAFRMDRQDIWVGLLYVWVMVDSFVLNSRIVSCERIVFWNTLLVFYLLIKKTPGGHSYVFTGIYFSGIIQAVYGWIQYITGDYSGHILFPVTGSFPNPAPFGGFMGIAVILSLLFIYRSLRKHNRVLTVVHTVFLFLLSGIFIIAFSRASWIALFAAGVFIVSLRLSGARRFIPVLLVVAAVGMLYPLRKQSADGRLFIWKVSLEMVSTAPLTGHGAQSFAAGYMYAQAHYFENNPDSPHRIQASNNGFAFNEGLRLWVEYGLVGLLLIGGIVVAAFRRTKHLYVKACLVYLLLFSCFSYPGDILSLSALLIVCLTDYKSKKVCLCRLARPVRYGVCMLLLCGAFVSGYQFIKSTGVYREITREKEGSVPGEVFERVHKEYRYNRGFILSAAHFYYRNQLYPNSVYYLEKASLYSPASEILYDLGNSYLQTGAIQQAEEAYKTAVYMTPSQILPHYYLFRFYLIHDEQKAIEWGEFILQTGFKHEGSVAMEAKNRITQALNSIRKEVEHE